MLVRDAARIVQFVDEASSVVTTLRKAERHARGIGERLAAAGAKPSADVLDRTLIDFEGMYYGFVNAERGLLGTFGAAHPFTQAVTNARGWAGHGIRVLKEEAYGLINPQHLRALAERPTAYRQAADAIDDLAHAIKGIRSGSPTALSDTATASVVANAGRMATVADDAARSIDDALAAVESGGGGAADAVTSAAGSLARIEQLLGRRLGSDHALVRKLAQDRATVSRVSSELLEGGSVGASAETALASRVAAWDVRDALHPIADAAATGRRIGSRAQRTAEAYTPDAARQLAKAHNVTPPTTLTPAALPPKQVTVPQPDSFRSTPMPWASA